MSLGSLPAGEAGFVGTDNPTVIALKYVEDAGQANRLDKMGVTGAEHIFANCRFYADSDTEATGCTLLAN
ncbi:uncharacterized protein METZ01_LOCUS272854 [marine metagenome]|uniref:High potential iron-sulfur proteins family profile domain-containing protein n=1 Tax=marine metagenome TaxID=408172 RepID=A0A382K6A3_9ZZZZ